VVVWQQEFPTLETTLELSNDVSLLIGKLWGTNTFGRRRVHVLRTRDTVVVRVEGAHIFFGS